ncbi:H-NS histone family protein [Roseovarius sp. D0-M9]|uniref:H-NS histone family protein n=1 Tax=Roseovarius sp. D0-M9 TaxID=3127117 RepID=UPI00300FD98F
MNKSEMLKLSYAELQRMKENLDDVISQKRDEEREKAREELEKRARELGFEAGDLFSNSKPKKKAKVPAKYAHPENPSKTWSGRGRQPNWIKEHLENGGKLEDLAL